MFKAVRKSGSSWAVPLILCVLIVRMMIPAGWMPTVDGAGYTRITLCTGMGTQDAWLDDTGKLHKSDPGKQHQGDSPCVFAGLGATHDVPVVAMPALPTLTSPIVARLLAVTVSIGRGLAAPPPPSTGPPTLI